MPLHSEMFCVRVRGAASFIYSGRLCSETRSPKQQEKTPHFTTVPTPLQGRASQMSTIKCIQCLIQATAINHAVCALSIAGGVASRDYKVT